jgi:uncharacterized low-complexity protein
MDDAKGEAGAADDAAHAKGDEKAAGDKAGEGSCGEGACSADADADAKKAKDKS